MTKYFANYPNRYPGTSGHFGHSDESSIPPELQAEMDKITQAYPTISKTHKFIENLPSIRKHHQTRPTAVSHADRLSQMCGSCSCLPWAMKGARPHPEQSPLSQARP